MNIFTGFSWVFISQCMNGFTAGLILTQKQQGTQKWPIG